MESTDSTLYLVGKYPILDHFAYEHLPENLKGVSKLFCDLAWNMAENLPFNPETSAGLRKLLEAKDCFVRAARKK